jgi:hypothetical protein
MNLFGFLRIGMNNWIRDKPLLGRQIIKWVHIILKIEACEKSNSKQSKLRYKYSKFIHKPKDIKLMHELAEVSDGCQQCYMYSCQSFIYYLADDCVGRYKPNVAH